MKNLKTFDTKKELNKAINAVESHGVRCNAISNDGEFVLQVHISDFIKARDVILDCNKENE